MDDLSFKTIFDGWSSILRTLVIGSITYIYIVVLVRSFGKRSLSKMNAYDLVITIALGSVLSTAILTKDVSLIQGATAITLLLVLQFINSLLAIHSKAFRKLIKSQPALLVYQGEILEDAMRHERITREDLLAGLRQKGHSQLRDVDAVVLETDGSLSVIKQGLSDPAHLINHGLSATSR